MNFQRVLVGARPWCNMEAAHLLDLEDDTQEERNEALADGTLLLGDQFTITNRIGNGGFGITYLAKDNYLDRDVVIKECFPEVFCHRSGKSVLVRSTANHDKYRSIVDMFMREARSIAKMRHPNIIGVHRVFEDNDTAYMALDLIDGRDLLEIITNDPNALTPTQVQNILVKILDAVDLVHKQDLLHRDISPDNILLDKWGSPVLIDFGAAREEASRETRAMSAVLIVKDGYSPQEFYFAGGKQTPSSDLYALAATFYHVISGEVPPNSQTRMAEVASGSQDPCVPLAGRFDAYPREFLAAIDKAMRVLPRERLQSAANWIAMIDTSEDRKEQLVLKPFNDLDKELTRLISETNEYVLKSAEAPAPPKPPAPKAEPSFSIPDWVREFNEESEEPVTNNNGTLLLQADDAVSAKEYDSVYIANDPGPMPVRLREKLRSRITKIRASWLVLILALSVVGGDPSQLVLTAKTLFQ
ncbi:serine/threonine protein kinase [Yoonia sediminilitoris]|uniref:Serine/threonine protein kinase n=1 Tax=Yoonia sediminilitoris TaxID=1286148 RepID=A0A2T6KLR2_9RHOB|nr:serine/threonine-protein kinase [Yoonia sediminilitoris]PUB17149.1 serine/threonine protein kinase [Yoonia sediminilitoris]RCW97444.1 serine/threonine protein kinase [Yoonia sediminilitoris]